MPDEDNPFLEIKKKEAPKSGENFGDQEIVSFMVTPEEAKELKDKPAEADHSAPHYEDAGTPIWDRKGANLNNPTYEVVNHDGKKKEEKDER